MSTQYHCDNDNRHQLVANSTTEPGLSPLNGIDFIEVASVDQKSLALHFLHPLPGELNGVPGVPVLAKENISITGGVRIQNIHVEKVSASSEVLTIDVDKSGDFSFYALRLVKSSSDPAAPAGFDPQLAEIEFSFKAGCPSDFDCQAVKRCPPEPRVEPDIDYLAKDYASFRRLMLDRMSVLVPDWQERNPADAQVALIEMLAYVGDHLSYFQDAVATEAYLGTARRRVSVRRHARLLDYFMHEGCNARTWLFLEAAASNVLVPQGSAFATKGQLSKIPRQDSAIVFETMHDVTLHTAHNSISFYTWTDTECCLPKGATRATLKNVPALSLQAGNLLLFEEALGAQTGNAADALPSHRQVVRLKTVMPRTDPLNGTAVLDIEWYEADALVFPLCLSKTLEDASGAPQVAEISVARGNIVLADHGRIETNEALGETVANIAFRPALALAPLTHQAHARDSFDKLIMDGAGLPLAFDPKAAASAATRWEMQDTFPEVELVEDGIRSWHTVRDLLNADRFARRFVAEMDGQGRAQLRFGDGIVGQKPSGKFTATYRVGNGREGNVGADTITERVTPLSDITAVRNPLPARGGTDPESLEEVRQFAPQAFRVQQRAVTEADWSEVTERHPEVQKAAARFRWTGSWFTVFVTIDRKGGQPVDADFETMMRRHLERYRIAGYDLEVEAPVFVPLDISMSVCVKPGYFRSEVKQRLLDAFSSDVLPTGDRGYFHPDNFTFAQPVYLSQVYRTAMHQFGVASVEIKRFQRWGKTANQEIAQGLLRPAALEILRLDNDRNFPENGKIEFDLHGGL